MSRVLSLLVVAVGLVNLGGCGSGQQQLAQVPATDNRPAEVKEADDLMLKNVQKIKGSVR